MDSIYWVITHNCNDQCAHCYNQSAPSGRSLSLEEADLVLDNLPEAAPLRLILSGGEPLTRRKLLFHCLQGARDRYGQQTQLMVQTNGDLLSERTLDQLLEAGVTRIDIASIDRYHQYQGERLESLDKLFQSRQLTRDDQGALISSQRLINPTPTYAFWGANENFWIGGAWPRGRALASGAHQGVAPEHNFCGIMSGGIGFLGGQGVPQEVAIQLYYLYPCCPSTKKPLADLRKQSLANALEALKSHALWQALNRGQPQEMAQSYGVSAEQARKEILRLGGVCQFCVQVLQNYYQGPGVPKPDLDLTVARQEKLIQLPKRSL